MDLARDKNGKTEAEFLRDYDVSQYFRPSVTVDAVLYRALAENVLRVLMIKRGGHPFIGMYAFPGGFVEKDESCEVAVSRELQEETGIEGLPLGQLTTVSTPDRDPRWRNITVVYAAEVAGDIGLVAGDDAADAKWFDVTAGGDTLRFVST
ncbi:MAG: NUDIX hydrolase, partial [Clostridiales bacterium]|nr:NUDIX hydrolase [Clostridiales bacterium]